MYCYLPVTPDVLWNNELKTLALLKLQSGVFGWAIVGTKSPHLCLLVLFKKLRFIFTKLLFGSHKQAFWQMTTMIRILRDFKPILHLNLYSEYRLEERITGSKIDVDLSAGSTYMRVYTIGEGQLIMETYLTYTAMSQIWTLNSEIYSAIL